MYSLKDEYKAFQKELGATGAGLKLEELVEGSRAKNLIGMYHPVC